MPNAHQELGPNDKVCHVHFAENDIRKGLRVVVGGKEGLQLPDFVCSDCCKQKSSCL